MNRASSQLTLPLPTRAALGRDDFVIGEANRAAVAWVDRWPDWPAPALTIHGPPACGKSHLATVWQLRADAVPVGDVAALVEASDLPPALLLEAADDYLASAEPAPLFHLYNRLAETGGHLLLTARTAPSRWTIDLPDLRSRLVAAPAVAIGAPDDDLLAALLAKLFADRQLKVSDDVISYLLPRIDRSFATARRLVDRLDAAALRARAPVTVPLARRVLADLDNETS
ncbi:MAG: DnaA/Hda family protein [Alphaproteobacteria bacterium]